MSDRSELERIRATLNHACIEHSGLSQAARVDRLIARERATREILKTQIRKRKALETACAMALEWINNLVAQHGQDIVINSMPNNCGGRNQLCRALEKEPYQ
jgi:hypothetical protein